jgi:hypothetical protein
VAGLGDNLSFRTPCDPWGFAPGCRGFPSVIIRQGSKAPVVIRRLQDSRYAQTDPNVIRYGLQTYVGSAVICQQTAVGALCAVYAGSDSIASDPLFVNPAAGDLHLKSPAGRWTSSEWVIDAVSSPCIDAGRPADACCNEPTPNGRRIDMGAYGNTSQASKSCCSGCPGEEITDDNSDDFKLTTEEPVKTGEPREVEVF